LEEETEMRILVLAGGFDQIRLITGLKQRGHSVYLADYLSNPPAKKYADDHYQVSTLDVIAIKELVQREKLDMIATACTDQALLTAAKVSEELGMPFYLDYKTALNVTNKQYMKHIFKECGIQTAEFITLKDVCDIEAVVRRLSFPMVVKPCDCNSSKGVVTVRDETTLVAAVKQAFELSRSKTVIVEEFISGDEISIDLWIGNDEVHLLSVTGTNKIKTSKDQFTIYQSKYPVITEDDVLDKIKQTGEKIRKAFQLADTPMLIQAILHEDEVYVIEFSARMGGGTKYQLIEQISGIDIMECYIERILGQGSPELCVETSKEKIELNYIYAYPGIVDELINFDTLKEQEVISDYFIYKERGEIITKATTSSDRIAGFLIKAASEQELIEKRKKAVSDLDVLNTEAKSMMIKYIY